jgi:hypothetical protein
MTVETTFPLPHHRIEAVHKIWEIIYNLGIIMFVGMMYRIISSWSG